VCLLAQVSIYVNPTQFAVGEDLDTYPRDPEGDHAKLASVGVDAVFEPQTLYAPESEPAHETYVTVENLQVRPDESRGGSLYSTPRGCVPQRGLCGQSRPTHFRGVATVVSKLFNIVRPDIAVRLPP
jgi:pantoate--beta-alanine ligase